MPRIIDADKLRTIRSIQSGDFNSIETIQKWIDDAPTVDAEPVHHGRWLDVLVADDEGETDGVECSECGYTDINVYWAKTYHKYCPNCGARMDEVRKDADNN